MTVRVTERGNRKVRQYASRLLVAVIIAISIFGFLRTVTAQNAVEGEEEGATSTIAATTSTVAASKSPAAPLSAVPWYQSDWISGQGIDRGDFVVGPGKIELEIKPGETVIKEITVANRISDDRTFELFVEDVAGTQDGSSVQLLGQGRGPYTLKDYISFPGNKLTLDLGERARIPVSISIPADAEPGGRYGSVLITTVQDDGAEGAEGEPATRSPIIARLGILFFITVPGAVLRDGETLELALIGKPWWYEEGPITFGISYENRGSVHVNPYGELRITNMFGEEVGFQELEPWFVLPKSLRTREISWDREFLLGRYTATVAINRGYDDVVDERTVTFWVLPWKIMGGVFLGIFIFLIALRSFFRTFEFKRKSA
jgi:hypothetical protein